MPSCDSAGLAPEAGESAANGDTPRLRVPGDKSIAHRILMVASMRDGVTKVSNVPPGEDVAATIRVLRQLGARVERIGSAEYLVRGWGDAGPTQPDRPLDCGNSGTTARLIMGVIAPWDIEAEVTGDDSLRSRPMQRVIGPLAKMGVAFDGDALPMTIHGTRSLCAGTFNLPVSSAQVKSALLLAGLHAQGEQKVTEPFPSRNHTEILLESGLIARTGYVDYRIPGDPSSAAFVLTAALLSSSNGAIIEDVCLNPTRVGFVRVLQRMGADVRIRPTGESQGELVGTMTVHPLSTAWSLKSVTVEADEIPQLIDEVPILALTAAFAHGGTVFRGVNELKVKESDRIEAIAEGLGKIGVHVALCANSNNIDMTICGRPDLLDRSGILLPDGVMLDARGDHRIALTWLVARSCSASQVHVGGADSIAVSYPAFEDDIKGIK